MNKIKNITYSFLSLFLVFPSFVLAKYGLDETDVIFYSSKEGKTIVGIVQSAILWLLSFVGGLAVLMIIVSGIMYITSGGDEGRVEKAKNWLIYAIVGLIIALLGWVIVKTIINEL